MKRVALIGFTLIVLGIIAYWGYRFFSPTEGPVLKSEKDLLMIQKFLEQYPTVVFLAHSPASGELLPLIQPFIPRLQHLNMVEKLLVTKLNGPLWLVARNSPETFPYWTWLLVLPGQENFLDLLQMARPLIPDSIKIRSLRPMNLCQKGVVVVGLDHPWGRSFEVQQCNSMLVVAPELLSWSDVIASLNTVFQNLKKSNDTAGQTENSSSLFTLWIDISRFPSEALSPLFRGRTAQISEFIRQHVTRKGFYRIRLWPASKDYLRWEIYGPWPPIAIDKNQPSP